MNAQIQTAKLDAAKTQAANTSWKNLYYAGGAAALLTIVFMPIQIAVFILKPLPSTVIGWFNLFQESKIIGLLDLDLLLVADQVLAILVFLAIFAALHKGSLSIMAIGTILAFTSCVLFITSNPAFEMASISSQYAAAETETGRNLFLAAGQALIASWQGSAFQVSYFLGAVGSIIVSWVMLRSGLFSKAAGILGILGNAISLGLYVPKVGIYISVFSVVFLWAWYLLVGVKLLQLGRATPGAA